MRMSLTAVGLLLLVGSATSAIVTVTPGVDNLQTAINAANDGDELVLDDGTYTSSTTVTPNAVASIDSGNGFLPTFITIRARNPLKAIIDGESTRGNFYIVGPSSYIIVPGNAISVTLQGLRIIQGAAATSDGGGIFFRNGNLKIVACVITGNSATASSWRGGGISINDGDVTVTNSEITSNTSPLGAGVHLTNSNFKATIFTMENSIISNNIAPTKILSVSSGGGSIEVHALGAPLTMLNRCMFTHPLSLSSMLRLCFPDRTIGRWRYSDREQCCHPCPSQ